ncbi:OmpA family protein [Nitrospina gracilis]|uniref:OmpA family protein n=1 Tax=Nitrospina gracilis TaxID=35801 RepID=UPI001F45914A|nr:OmpA family protein [Nitrospina gracilis]MCF8720472.1 flagellar motor protein MotB [Nitrospina gracilis Nb-211]
MTQENSVQHLKEQLKIKNQELRKQVRETSRLSDKMNNITVLNKEKVNELLSLIKQKEEEVKEAREAVWAARMSKRTSGQGNEKTGDETEEGEIDAELENEVIDPKILKELEDTKNSLQSLRGLFKETREELKKVSNDKSLLIKEVKRTRKELDRVKTLKDEVIRLKKELDQKAGPSYQQLEKEISDKETKIEKLERIIKDATQDREDGKLPAEIIFELRMELNELLHEKERLVIELDQTKDYNEELESKVQTLEEKQVSRQLEGQIAHEHRSSFRTAFVSMEGFLVTYSDMITLLLAIFVMLFTMSNIDENKFVEAISSFQEKEVRVTSQNVRLSHQEIKMLERVRELVKDNVDPEELVRGDVKTKLIRLKSEELFSPGKATLIPGAEETIFQAIQEDLKQGVKQIHVEGHTDDVPISTEAFPSNWELSTSRAARVARYIIEELKFPSELIVVSGYGEFRPLKPNNTDSNRAMNRRVEIKILKDKEVLKEENGRKKQGRNGEPVQKT